MFFAGIYAEKERSRRALDIYPAESWVDIAPNKYYVISPPGMMWVFEIEIIDGEKKWRQVLMPIPKSWNIPSNYVSPEERKEKDFREKKRFEGELHQHQNPTIETSKKKKKPDETINGELTDSNQDGMVEFSIPLYRPYSFVHICCGDGFTHRVYTRVVLGPLGMPWMYMRWEVDPDATHRNRVKKWGPGYWKPNDSFNSRPWDQRDSPFSVTK
jgi:hypothetical protein